MKFTSVAFLPKINNPGTTMITYIKNVNEGMFYKLFDPTELLKILKAIRNKESMRNHNNQGEPKDT